MKLRVAITVPLIAVCTVLALYHPVLPVLLLEGLAAARALCMEAGRLLLGLLTILDFRLVLAAIVPAFLVSLATALSSLVRTRGVTAELLNHQLRPFPRKIHDLASELGIESRTYVVESDSPFAFCVGLTKPRIILSTGLVGRLSHDELEAVLRHETWHAEHFDSLFVTLGLAAQRGLFFLPPVREIVGRALARREIRADESAIAAMGSPYPLASALSKALHWPEVSAAAAAGAFSAADARIDYILGETRSSRDTRTHSLLAAGVLSAAGLGLFVCGVVAAAGGLSPTMCGTC